MRIIFLGNNRVGLDILTFLREQGEEIVGLVIHPKGKRKFGDEMVSVVDVAPQHTYEGPGLRTPEVLESIRALHPDLGISILFDYLLAPPFLNLFPSGVINLHPAYLPFNRGQYPNVWSIVEGTPAGATLHYIDRGLDTGDIISRKQVPMEPVDTGATLYRKLEEACIEVFKKSWPDIRAGKVPRNPQDPQAGTYHATRDVDRIDAIELDKKYTARELIDVIRARTFAPYSGAYFTDGGRRVYMRLQLSYEDQLNGENNGSAY